MIGSCPVNTDKICTQVYPKNFGDELTGETIEELRKIAKSTPYELKLGDWERVLTPEQFKVTRLNCTELRNTSPLNNVHEHGIFHCVNCDNPLFDFEFGKNQANTLFELEFGKTKQIHCLRFVFYPESHSPLPLPTSLTLSYL